MLKKPLLAMIAFCAGLACSSCTSFYLGRYLIWNFADVRDYEHYPSRAIQNDGPVFEFRESAEARARFQRLCPTVSYEFKGNTLTTDLERFLLQTQTTAFLVIQDDTILYEGYFHGYRRDSICTSFSVAKSFTSALVGIAIDEGCIGSEEDPITKYIPELKDPRLSRVTIRHLLAMCSGFRFSLSTGPCSEDPRAYFSPDLRRFAMHPKIEGEPGRRFNYNPSHTQLLGIILERTTGRSVSRYLEEKIWRPLGMEYPASWSLDSERSGFELMSVGLNARAVDYARFGRLYLRGGDWNGRRIVPEDWVARSTVEDPIARQVPAYYTTNFARSWPEWQEFLASGVGYYGWHWWGYRREGGPDDFFAEGLLGQHIYVSPAKNLVIVRNGIDEKKTDFYPAILKQIADRL